MAKEGENVKTGTDFIFLGSKLTEDGDYSHEIWRCFLLGRKATTNLDNILKTRDITLPTKVRIVKAMVFPVVTYESQSWTSIKNADHKRTMLENTLETPLDCKEINPVNPKGNQPWIFIGRIDTETEASVFWPLDAKSWLIGKTLMLGKMESRRKKRWWRMTWLDSITDSMDRCLSKPWEIVKDREGSLVCCSP